MTLGETIFYYRKEVLDWTQKQLGDAIGVSPSCIGHYEHDRHNISPETLRRLCEIFNIPASTLLGTTGQEISAAMLQKEPSDRSSYASTSHQATDSLLRESALLPQFLSSDISPEEDTMLWNQLHNYYVHLEAQDKRRLVRIASELDEEAIKARRKAIKKR